MFPGRYFSVRFYAPRYFPKAGATAAAVAWFNGLTTSIRLTGVGQ